MTTEPSWVFGLSESIATGALVISVAGWVVTHILNGKAQQRNRRLARLDSAEDIGSDMATMHAEYLTLAGSSNQAAQLSQQISMKGRKFLLIVTEIFPDADRGVTDSLYAFHDYVTAHDRSRAPTALGSLETQIAFDRLMRFVAEARKRVS